MVDENGIDPVAGDGEPFEAGADNELENRRKLAEARARAEEEGTGMTGKKRGAPIDDQPDADEPEMFPMGAIVGDHKITVKNILPAGKSRKVEAKLRATPIPLKDGLVRYGEVLELLVTVEAGKIEEVPDLEEPESGGRRVLNGVKDVQHFRPVHVADARQMYSLAQVLEILEDKFGIARTDPQIAEVFGADAVAA